VRTFIELRIEPLLTVVNIVCGMTAPMIRTALGPLLVHDAVTTLSATDRLTRLDLVLCSAIWKKSESIERLERGRQVLPAHRYSMSCFGGGKNEAPPPTCWVLADGCLFMMAVKDKFA
jgi:hypothetical protein